MSAEENKTLIRKHIERIAKKDLDAVFAEVSPNFVDHELQAGMAPGKDGTRQFFTMLLAAFPDMEPTVEQLLAEGDLVVARMTIRGTQTGSFMGLPPTGKYATWSIIDLYRLDGGKLVEHWGLSDQVALLQQLGVLPPN